VHGFTTRTRGHERAAILFALVGFAAASTGVTLDLHADPVRRSRHSDAVTSVRSDGGEGTGLAKSLAGRSGKLRAYFVSQIREAFAIPALQQLFGDSALSKPGVYTIDDSTAQYPFAFITMLPFSAKQRGRIGAYRLGSWPYERRTPRSPAYANPEGFIEVTPENQDTYVSEHFRLRDFLTHDQQSVWPKYLVLSERLVDKLELVIDDLNQHGVPVTHMTVMSGFRTPRYNVQGVGEGGRARDSRHQYGDAADVFVDNDGCGRMDDLNRDGRVDRRDAQVILDAVERVEAGHPEFTGGVGVYKATAAHGPFAHVDARGTRARWGIM
jgi:Peptidase M15